MSNEQQQGGPMPPIEMPSQQGVVLLPKNEHERLLQLAGGSLSDKQVAALSTATPKAIVKQVSLRGGNYSYVPHSYFTKRLNEIFKHIWSWEIVKYEMLWDVKQVVVHGRLRVMLGNGVVITKEAFGGSDIKYYSATHKTKPNMPMDVADNLKGASSDAKKKAASELGIALDVYAPVLDQAGLTDFEISDDEKKMVQHHIDIIKKANSVPTLEMYGDTLDTQIFTPAQLNYIRNEYAVMMHTLKNGAGTEPVLAMLDEAKTIAAINSLCVELSEGKHGQFDPESWKRVMEKAKERRAKLAPKPSTSTAPKPAQ